MRRRFLPGLLTLALVAGACSDRTLTDPPAAAARVPAALAGTRIGDANSYGVVLDNASGATLDMLLSNADNLEVGWIRFTFRWYLLQPSGPAFDPALLSQYREMIAEARGRGFNVFVTLEGVPAWTHRCTEPGSIYYGRTDVDCGAWQYPPDDANWNAWQMYVAALVGTHFAGYPYDVQAWGIGNEPNSTGFFRVLPGRDVVTEYGKMVAYAANEIHARGGTVVGPDLGQDGAAGYAFLGKVLRGYGSYLDVVSIHQYNTADGTRYDMGVARDSINRWAPGRQLWLTETGETTYSAINEMQQTQHIAGQLDEMQDGIGADWDKTFYFRLQGPIDASHPYSWLVDEATGAQRGYPYDCLQWYAGGFSPTPPLYCVRTAGR